RSCSFVEAAIGEGAGPRQETQRFAAGDAALKGDLVAAARPVAVALTPEERVAASRRGVNAAEDFLEQAGEELVGLVRRPDDEGAARPQQVERLFDHVDLETAFAAAGGGVEEGLEVGRQVPQVGGGDDTGGQAALVQFAAQPFRLVEIHL